MKKQEELYKNITEMLKETKRGKIHWKIDFQTTEYNDADTKPQVQEESTLWLVDECYTSYYCEFRGKEFLMITYEMIHSCGEKKKTTNMIFLPPLGIRVFDIHALLSYAVEADQMLIYQVHTLWLAILDLQKTHPQMVELEASPRELTIED